MAKAIGAAVYQHRVVIYEPNESDNAYGETVADDDNPRLVSTRWADMEALSGREYFEAQQVQSAVTHRCTMRYYADLTSKMWIEWDGKTFNIESVEHSRTRKRETVVMCIEKV